MQHYGLPTRLLDWTETPLVAAYFALEDTARDDEDGAVWAIIPSRLNRSQAEAESIQSPYSDTVAPLFAKVFNRYMESDQRILAVGATQKDLRQMVQQSAFTVHGCETALDRLDSAEDFVYKLIIPKTHKEDFRRILSVLGVNGSWLFPDLQNLAAHLDTVVCGGL